MKEHGINLANTELVITKLDWAGTIASIEVLTKMFLYYFHERAWYKFSKFGVNKN